MKIINRRILLDYCNKHPASRLPLQTWFHLARCARWSSPGDMRVDHPDASFITRDWVSLPLKAAACRLVMQISFPHSLVILRHITYHASGSIPGGI